MEYKNSIKKIKKIIYIILPPIQINNKNILEKSLRNQVFYDYISYDKTNKLIMMNDKEKTTFTYEIKKVKIKRRSINSRNQ